MEQKKRDQVLEVAKALFLEAGFKAITMDYLCRRCGISKKTLYIMFASKEALFMEIIREEDERDMAYIFDHIQKTLPPKERLVQLMYEATQYLTKDKFKTRLLRDEVSLQCRQLLEQYDRFIEESVIKKLSTIIREGQRLGGDFRQMDPELMAYSMFKLYKAFTYERTMIFEENKIEDNYYLAFLQDFIFQGACREGGTL